MPLCCRKNANERSASQQSSHGSDYKDLYPTQRVMLALRGFCSFFFMESSASQVRSSGGENSNRLQVGVSIWTCDVVGTALELVTFRLTHEHTATITGECAATLECGL